jgi:protein-S-isoprenylcysteine O-methyltransferase Ste14
MGLVLFAITLVSLLAAIPLIARVKREYEGPGVLSDPTVVGVWVLYTAIVAVVLLAAVEGIWPIGLPTLVSVAIGVPLIAAGLALEVGGLASMASFRRMSGMQPDRLITDGAFRLSRNPQNVGVGMILVGAALLGDSWLALLAAAGFWTTFRLYVGFEEAHLARTFGAEFERYRRLTPRFLGVPRREGSSV